MATAAIAIQPISPRDSAARELIRRLDEFQLSLYPAECCHLDSVEELEKPHVRFVGAFEDGRMVGCGAVKFMPEGYGEVKRMYVSPQARGRGVGAAILARLEQLAAQAGLCTLRLETGVRQPEARALYRKCGFRERGPFGAYVQDQTSVYFEKRIEPPPSQG